MMAERLCNKQPYPVRYRLLKDEGFISKYDLKPGVGIIIGGKIHLNQHVLISGIKRLFEKKIKIQLPDVEGHKHSLSLEKGHINFESASKEIKAQLDNFYILSFDRDERVNKLNELVFATGPMSQDFSELKAEAENQELSYEQIDKLLHEIYTGVAALQDRAREAFELQKATIDNLVPDSLTYYEYFCGPDPGDASPEEYLSSTLPTYRKELIKKDFVKGLDVCLQGALCDDLMPGAWISGYSDDEIWKSLQACDPFRDPFALLGALDIAIWRQTDNRFKVFAEDALKKLFKDDFLRPDGIDVYQLMPSLAELILNRINILEGGVLRPPYWKRMCAWMQAGFLIRQTQKLKLDFDSLKGWISANMTQAGVFGNLSDLRREPMYRAAEMTPSAFREEIVGRLVTMHNRHEKAGKSTLMANDIDSVVSELESKSAPFCWALPGPLEGHVLTSEKRSELTEETIKQCCEDLFSEKFEKLLSSLSYLSQLYIFNEELLIKIREAIDNISFGEKFTGFPSILMRVIDAGIIASTQKDKELSRIIGTKIVSASNWVNTEFTVKSVVQAILFTGAVFQEESEWVEWIEPQLVEVAYRLPPGDRMKEFLFYIRELKKVLNLKTAVVSKAEAVASAAI